MVKAIVAVYWLSIGMMLYPLDGFVPISHVARPHCSSPAVVDHDSTNKEKGAGPLFYESSIDQRTTTAGTSTSAASSASKKKRRRRKTSSKNGGTNAKNKGDIMFGRSLSEEELIQHVTAQYVTGAGGVLHAASKKSQKNSEKVENEQKKYLQKLDRHPALVLNADYQPISYLPLSMWHWQEAIKAVFAGKVTVVDTYSDVTIRAATLEIPLPSVIALNDYVPQPNTRPAFTKRNVFLRDEYRCQYCNDRFHTKDLSLDHVVPRSKGGHLSWENAVTSCRTCNGRKGSLSVQQLRSVGMKLLKEPIVPTQFQLHMNAGRLLPRRVHPTWAPYLKGCNINDDQDDEPEDLSSKNQQPTSMGSQLPKGDEYNYFEDVAL